MWLSFIFMFYILFSKHKYDIHFNWKDNIVYGHRNNIYNSNSCQDEFICNLHQVLAIYAI